MNHESALKAAADAVPSDLKGLLTLEEIKGIIDVYFAKMGIRVTLMIEDGNGTFAPGSLLPGERDGKPRDWFVLPVHDG